MTRKMTKWLCVVALAVVGNAHAQNATPAHDAGSSHDPVRMDKATTLIDPNTGRVYAPTAGRDAKSNVGLYGKALEQRIGQGNDLGLKSLSRAEVRELQKALKQYGFYDGAVDGSVGPNTYAALGAFKHSRGDTVSGRIDLATATALGIEIVEWQRGRTDDGMLDEIQPVRGGDEDSVDIPETRIDLDTPGFNAPTPGDAGGDEIEGNMDSGNTTPGTTPTR